jgi:hypothetical protein
MQYGGHWHANCASIGGAALNDPIVAPHNLARAQLEEDVAAAHIHSIHGQCRHARQVIDGSHAPLVRRHSQVPEANERDELFVVSVL